MCSGGGISKILSAAEPEKNYGFWKMIMEKCGAKTLDEFRKVPLEKLFSVWQENKKATMGGGASPCIDGALVVGKAHEILAKGEQHDIPYLIGTTSHDVVPPILYSMAKKWCYKQSSPAYLWFFERNLPGDNHGAWHSADLWYWFGTLDNCWRPFTDKDRALSEEMSDRLCAFASSGNPNTKDYVTWHAGGKCALTLGDYDTKESTPSSLKLWVTMFTNEAPGE
jgi:para-nitrobenzyl esterase